MTPYSTEPGRKLSVRLFWAIEHLAKLQTDLQAFWADEIGISLTQWLILRAIRDFGEIKRMSISDLATKIPMDLSFLSSKLKELEHRGLLKREKSKEDRRTILVTLSDEGLSRLTIITEQEKGFDTFVVGGMQTDQVEDFIEKADRLKSRLLKVPMIRKSNG